MNTNTNTNTKRTTEQLREWREVELEALRDWAEADGYADERGAIAMLGDAGDATTLLYGDGERIMRLLLSSMICNDELAGIVMLASRAYDLIASAKKTNVAGEGEGHE